MFAFLYHEAVDIEMKTRASVEEHELIKSAAMLCTSHYLIIEMCFCFPAV